MRHPAAVLVLLLLLAPALPSGHAQSNGPDGRLRLYGCSDDLDQTGEGPTIGLDGILDCEGDHLRLPAAWLSGATDPGLRAALPTHDQRVDLTVVHHPSYWAPAPGSTADPSREIAQPGDPDRGLFDVTNALEPGRLDLSLVSDEAVDPNLDANDQPDPVDLAPADGFVDRAERNDGRDPGADYYFPAIETRYDLTWWRDSADPVPLPSGGHLLFPGVTPTRGLDNPDAWAPDQDPPRVQWHATPFGYGSGNDATGALVTAPITIRPGDTARFLDHSVALVDIVNPDGRASAKLDVRYAGRTVPALIGDNVLLDLDPDQQTPATANSRGVDARNVLFADTRGTSRTPPAGSDTIDAPWFVLVTRVDNDTARPQATLRLGRFVSAAAPLNAMIVEGGLYRVTALDERDGALHGLGWSRILPIGDDHRFRQIAVDVPSVRPDARIPFLPPFDRDHAHLQDVRADVQRDAYGFLRERSGGNGIIGTAELALLPGSAAPADRARRTDALDMRWLERGMERRLTTSMLDVDGVLGRVLVAPFRYVTLAADDTVLVHSSLFDDSDVIVGATEARDTPRAARSFVSSPAEPFLPYVDDGLHIYSGTRADPNAADVLRLTTAVVRPPDRIGQTRLPDALAAQRIDLDVRYQAYHVYETTGKGLRPVSDESIDRAIDPNADPHIIDATRDAMGDNLYDVVPRNNEPQLGDIYGPVMHVRYTGRLVDPNTLTPVDAPFDANTRVFVPAADRDPDQAGLDSADLNGDGSDEGIAVAGYWDRDATGDVPAHWKTDAEFDPEHDLVWLQSPLLEVPLGGDGRLFDHGIRYVSYDGASERTGQFEIMDLRARGLESEPGASTLRTAPGECLTVRRDGNAVAHPVPCAARTPAALGAPYPLRANDDKWWVEVVAVGAASASVRMHRVVAPPTDDAPMWVDGVMYRWHEWTAGRSSGVGSWRLEALVPLGTDVALRPGSPSASLAAVQAGGRLSFLPPFDGPHTIVRETGVAATRDTYGFEGDVAAGRPADRLRAAAPLFVQVESRDETRGHRFVHLDPTRWADPMRGPGHAFVGGTFATPWHGIVETAFWLQPSVHELKVRGPDGFDGALRASGDRGWDHHVTLDLPIGNGPYRLDSARLGAPSRTAAVDAADPWLAGRMSAYYVHDAAEPIDPYGGPRAAAPMVPPGAGPGTPPPVPPDGPVGNGNGTDGEDGPAPGSVAVAGALVLVLAFLRAGVRRRP